MAIKLHDSFAIHPGPWLLEEIVKPYNMNVSSTADHLKVTRPALSRLLNGRAALTPEMAIRFEKAFGVRADTLLRMQAEIVAPTGVCGQNGRPRGPAGRPAAPRGAPTPPGAR